MNVDIKTYEAKSVGNDPKTKVLSNDQSPLSTKKNFGSGKKTISSNSKLKSPRFLVKLRSGLNEGQQTPKNKKKRGLKLNSGNKRNSPSLKSNKKLDKRTKTDKMMSASKMKSIKDYFESLSNKAQDFPTVKANHEDKNNISKDLNDVATKKVRVKHRIEALESFKCFSRGDTPTKTPRMKLKRLGDNPTK